MKEGGGSRWLDRKLVVFVVLSLSFVFSVSLSLSIRTFPIPCFNPAFSFSLYLPSPPSTHPLSLFFSLSFRVPSIGPFVRFVFVLVVLSLHPPRSSSLFSLLSHLLFRASRVSPALSLSLSWLSRYVLLFNTLRFRSLVRNIPFSFSSPPFLFGLSDYVPTFWFETCKIPLHGSGWRMLGGKREREERGKGDGERAGDASREADFPVEFSSWETTLWTANTQADLFHVLLPFVSLSSFFPERNKHPPARRNSKLEAHLAVLPSFLFFDV